MNYCINIDSMSSIKFGIMYFIQIQWNFIHIRIVSLACYFNSKSIGILTTNCSKYIFIKSIIKFRYLCSIHCIVWSSNFYMKWKYFVIDLPLKFTYFKWELLSLIQHIFWYYLGDSECTDHDSLKYHHQIWNIDLIFVINSYFISFDFMPWNSWKYHRITMLNFIPL